MKHRITVTGADEHTPLTSLTKLVEWSEAEIGFLYTARPEERNRYPGMGWLLEASVIVHGRAAVHICGRGARMRLLNGELAELVSHCPRIQINGVLDVAEVEQFCALYPTHTIITQHCEANSCLAGHVAAPNHAVLVDGSGGRGISPVAWVRPDTTKAVGFAGGLGPENLLEQLPLIRHVAEGEWWVDMEGRLRDENDWFDARRAEVVVRSFHDAVRCV